MQESQGRKLIQIAVMAPGHDADKGYPPAVVGLADDGSVWVAGFKPEMHEWMDWKRLPNLPASMSSMCAPPTTQRAHRSEMTG